MIRIILLGRTGNHLFQYALGRVLAEKHGVELSLDASWFNEEGWREVSHFLKLPLNARVVRRCPLAARGLRKLTGKHYWEYRGVPVLRENATDHSFDSAFLDAPDECVLFGYFQSPLYFEKTAAALRSELKSLLNAAISVPHELRGKLEDPFSVAVHVRRTDYLHHPELMVCGLDYYHRAMRLVRSELPGARFFIFSDDPEWCREHFSDEDQEIANPPNRSRSPLPDLLLMSLASRHIIANSTYSWWAAWLAANEGHKVIMPDRWHARGITAPIAEKRCDGWRTVETC